MSQSFERVKKRYDCVVCGGGIGGVCAALAASRLGCKTALVQNRPVLGGNAPSEVKVHIGGAAHHGYHFDARESGIIEEIRLETAVRDPFNEYYWIDFVLYDLCTSEKNLDLFLNTEIFSVRTEKNRIVYVSGVQSGSEKIFDFYADIFVDSTGDGTVGFLAGAPFRRGREAASEFGEKNAPPEADNKTLGSSILFCARDVGRPVKFTPPRWAYKFDKKSLAHRSVAKSDDHGEYWHSDTVGWWWVEFGGESDTIKDNEEIKRELHKIIYGIWDYIKNKDPKWSRIAENFEIVWIGHIPGKRESRRLIGDYILKESDLLEMRNFPDAVAVGGWSIDLHPPGGFYHKGKAAEHTHIPLPYSIPFRSLYSAGIENLMMASRCISVTHVAHASTRLIGTLGCIGQAVGTAAYLCRKYGKTPRNVGREHIDELRRLILKYDGWILGAKNDDPDDIALKSVISADSEYPFIFGHPTEFKELMFPMAIRFYYPGGNKSPKIMLYLRNGRKEAVKVTGGVYMDPDVWEFTTGNFITGISAEIPPCYSGWVTFETEKEEIFERPAVYWIYLDECENVYWGKNSEWHMNGLRIGYFDEDREEWFTARNGGNPFYDYVVGFFGYLCFALKDAPSPYPAYMINNGEHRPYYSPNVWISAPFAEAPLKDPAEIIKRRRPAGDKIKIKVELPEPIHIGEIHLTFDTELNNSYPHTAYGREKVKDWPIPGKAPKAIRDMMIFYEYGDGTTDLVAEITDNYTRKVILRPGSERRAEKVTLVPLSNWGFHCFNLYEIRIYEK